ncbi:MAG: metal ABC transporter permease [Lachnospiraceae bacterium]|nr:metal ABC transporter permease [Lachnospiraceae bacterium]
MEILIYYLSFPFVQYALVVGVLVALCASLLGVSLVLKRYSFIGDGLSHVAFGAMAIATVMDIAEDLVVVMPVTVLAAVALLRLGQNAKIKGDSAIAMISVSSMAVGYLLLSIFSKSTNVSGDVCSTLFGSTSFLTLTVTDVVVCVVMSVAVLAIMAFYYHRIFAITFDENFAGANGVNVGLGNFVIATVTAVVIVLAMKLVGTLLISALVIFPALSAMRLFKNYKSVLGASALIAVSCALIGILMSILFSVPTGAMIVVTNAAVFLLFSMIGKLRGTD